MAYTNEQVIKAVKDQHTETIEKVEEIMSSFSKALTDKVFVEFEKSELRLDAKLIAIKKDVEYSRDHDRKQNGTLAEHDKMFQKYREVQLKAQIGIDDNEKDIKKVDEQIDKRIKGYQAICPANLTIRRLGKNMVLVLSLFILFIFTITWFSTHPEVFTKIVTKIKMVLPFI